MEEGAQAAQPLLPWEVADVGSKRVDRFHDGAAAAGRYALRMQGINLVQRVLDVMRRIILEMGRDCGGLRYEHLRQRFLGEAV